MAWSISSVSTYSSTRPAPPAIQAASSAEARTITPTQPPHTQRRRAPCRSWMQGRDGRRKGPAIRSIGLVYCAHIYTLPLEEKTVYILSLLSLYSPFSRLTRAQADLCYFFTSRVPVLWHFPPARCYNERSLRGGRPGKGRDVPMHELAITQSNPGYFAQGCPGAARPAHPDHPADHRPLFGGGAPSASRCTWTCWPGAPSPDGREDRSKDPAAAGALPHLRTGTSEIDRRPYRLPFLRRPGPAAAFGP